MLVAGVQTLARILDSIFRYIKFQFFYHYLDDLIIYSEDFESLVIHVEVFTLLHKAKVKPENIVFSEQEISF